jgi:outer membrane beta-barrel protein
MILKIMKSPKLILFLILALGSTSSIAIAQESDDLDVIELELDNSKPAPASGVAPAQTQSSSTQSEFSEREPTPKAKMTDFSGLGTLAPFREISVIQKRFMPKTGRFQAFAGGTLVTNDPFFLTFGGVGKGSYFLTEQWGVELNYFTLTTSTQQGTNDLKSNNNVATENLVYPKSFVGVDIVYSPIYGKMTWFNEKIVPFDLYFSAGYGSTSLQSGDNAGTLHLATGQIFALSKSHAFRWDFSWNFFNAKGVDKQTSTFNNLFLTVGMSWFFPEAGYR